MITHPNRVGSADPQAVPDRTDPRPASTTVRELQVAVLRCRVAALEQELVAERERRKAVVDRYERILRER